MKIVNLKKENIEYLEDLFKNKLGLTGIDYVKAISPFRGNATWTDTVNYLIDEMEDIQGQWNGDESGLAEERAGTADEIAGLLVQVKELLKEM